MSDRIEVVNGVAKFWCTGDQNSAWHLLGQRTPGAQTWQEAAELSGLNYIVERVQLRNPYTGKPLDKTYGLFRNTDHAHLGTVGDRYQIIQPSQMMEWSTQLAQAENKAVFDSAGSLCNGSRIFCSLKVPFDFEVVAGDTLTTYLLGTGSFDGQSAQEVKLTTTRVVCWNTLRAALSGSGEFYKVRHTRSAVRKMDAAVKALADVGSDVKALQLKLRRLAEVRLTRESMQTVLDRLFPKNESAGQTRRDNMLAEVLRLYEENDGNKISGIRGSAYNLFNAVTNYVDHARTARSADSDSESATVTARALSATFGSGDTLKTQALDVLLEESNSLSLMSL